MPFGWVSHVLKQYATKGTGLENLGTPPPNLTEAPLRWNVSPSLGGADEDSRPPAAQWVKFVLPDLRSSLVGET